jgi:hypothetical protein
MYAGSLAEPAVAGLLMYDSARTCPEYEASLVAVVAVGLA